MFASALEVANALVITYFATEYLLKDQLRYDRGVGESRGSVGASKAYQGGLLVWALVNLGYFVSKFFASAGNAGGASALGFRGLPSSLVLVAVFSAFLALCWWDVHRLKPDVSVKTFLRQTSVSALESLLILPLVSVGVALAFLVLIGILDAVHTSTVWLNSPIYYGVLYGPFSTIYFFTKKRCVSNRGHILPL